MAFLTGILPIYKEYIYLNDQNELQTRQLNILEYIFRQVFGWYEETHLKTVLEQAYPLTFDHDWKISDENSQKLLRLIEKANALEQVGEIKTFVGSFSDEPDNYTSEVTAQYSMVARRDPAAPTQIYAVTFDVKIKDFLDRETNCRFGIVKDREDRLVVKMPWNAFQGSRLSSSIDSVAEDLASPVAKIINGVLRGVLTGSQMPKLYTYLVWHEHSYNDEIQKDGMSAIGWSSTNDFGTDYGTIRDGVSKYRQYSTGAAGGDPYPQLSLQFAFQNMIQLENGYNIFV
ncbi:MAG: hypothetical protein HYX48_05185 [Chlamydiales bacterium]|nr:hypothetical protein [Chlamydiales bacterium]